MAEAVLKNEISAEDRQFNRNKWLFSVSGVGRDMAYSLIATFLLTYIQFGKTLSIVQFTTLSLLIGVLGRVWDAVNDPVMGAIIEGTHMKFGKFRPWILIGAVLTGAIIIAMFNVQSLNGWAFVVFMIIVYLLWETAFTMNDIGYWSMLASLSSKKEQRNSVTMLTVVFAGVGAFAAQGGISFLYPGNVQQAFSWISIAIAAIFVIMQTVMVLLIKERPRDQIEKEEKVSIKQMWNTIKNNDQILWMTLIMFFYNIGSGLLVGLAYNLYYLEIGYDGNAIIFIAIFGVFNIGSQIFYPKLAAKLGRKKLQTISIILACIGYLGIALLGWTDILPFNIVTLSIFGIMVFVGQAWYYMICIINMTNCVEYNEYKRGERNEAVVSTLRPFMAKFADALKYGLVTLVLIVSSVYGLSQNISTMEGQKGSFDRLETAIERVEYVTGVNTALTLYENYDEAKVEEINSEIDKIAGLEGKQINVEYLHSLGDVYIVMYNGDGSVANHFKLGEATVADYALLGAHDGSCKMIISNADANNGLPVFNAGNANFKESSNNSMRLWVRAFVSIVPVGFIVVSLIIMNKKFIIDEDYYDMMLVEIEKRKQSHGSTDAVAE